MVTDGSIPAAAGGGQGGRKRKSSCTTRRRPARLTNEDCSPNTVHYVYDTYRAGQGHRAAMVQAGGETWFFLTADYAFGHRLQADTTSGGQGQRRQGARLGRIRSTPDFSSFLLQAQASKAKVVGLANAGGDTINSIKAANEFGITKNQTHGRPAGLHHRHPRARLADHAGHVLTDGFYWNLNDETARLRQALLREDEEDAEHAAGRRLFGHDHYLKAVKAAGTDDGGVWRR